MVQKSTAAEVLDRLQSLIGVSSDSQLSAALSVNRQTLGSWRARDSVPYELCINIALERGASLNWLLTGDGPMLRGEDVAGLATANAREEAVLTVFRDLSEDEQREVQRVAEGKKRLREVEQKLAEVADAVARRKGVP